MEANTAGLGVESPKLIENYERIPIDNRQKSATYIRVSLAERTKTKISMRTRLPNASESEAFADAGKNYTILPDGE